MPNRAVWALVHVKEGAGEIKSIVGRPSRESFGLDTDRLAANPTRRNGSSRRETLTNDLSFPASSKIEEQYES